KSPVQEGQFALASPAILPTHITRAGIARAQQVRMPELRARNAHPTNHYDRIVSDRFAGRSVRRFVLSERLLELLHDGVGIAAGLAHVVDPLLLQWLGRFAP